MYVAMTRAREQVTLCHASFRMVAGVTGRQEASRFLSEIPDECIDRPGVSFGSDYEDDFDFPGGGGVVHDEADVDYGDYGDDEGGELQAGAHVIHPVYGRGEVLDIQGAGARMKVVVRFQNGREKTLIPEYAGLQVVPGSAGW